MVERDPAPEEDVKGPDWLERLATILSTLLVLAVIAVLIWDAAHPDRPPALDASAGTPHVVGKSWHVPINVRNAGDVAVQDVGVSVSLEHPDTTVKDVNIHIDWLPGRSEREIDAVFGVDPARGRVTAAVQSFDEPGPPLAVRHGAGNKAARPRASCSRPRCLRHDGAIRCVRSFHPSYRWFQSRRGCSRSA